MEEVQLKVASEITQAEATEIARKKLPPDAMLLAWYDRVTGTGRPEGPGPSSERYLADYARSRGAKAKAVVNDRFVLFFAPGVGTAI